MSRVSTKPLAVGGYMELEPAPYTVVVTDDDVDGMTARHLALQWHQDGLLDEFAWVTPGRRHQVHVRPSERDRDRDRSIVADRPADLARGPPPLADPDRRPAPADPRERRHDETCRGLRPDLGPRQPGHAPTDEPRSSGGTRLLRVNLMVPESDLQPQDLQLLEPSWEINAIVSPEDRPDLDRMNVFVRRATNLHGHGLAAAAAVGGLWADSPVGAFDSHEHDSTSGGGEVLVIRCQARIVVGDDRSEELAARVIETVQTSPVGAASMVTWGFPSDNPRALVEKFLDKLTEHPDWSPLQRASTPLEKVQVSLGTLLRNWGAFQLQLPVAVMSFLFGLGQEMIERSLTAATVGRGAGELGKVRPMSPDQARVVAEYRINTLTAELKPARLADEAASWGVTTPSAWRELRELVIGLVDGSRLPDRFPRNVRGGLDEVLPPAVVVAPPLDAWTTALRARSGRRSLTMVLGKATTAAPDRALRAPAGTGRRGRCHWGRPISCHSGRTPDASMPCRWPPPTTPRRTPIAWRPRRSIKKS